MTSGILNIDKPAGLSSAAVVGKVKRITGQACGHMGTLDPMACGVLPVGVGNANRLFDFLLEKNKEYVASFRFGAQSDTLDCTGEVNYNAGRIPSEQEICGVLPSLTGNVLQEPPLYSAKSVNGVRAYDLARREITFTLEKKCVYIREIVCNGETGTGEYSFTVRCGGGTYIRAIARDLAAALGTHAIMTSLVRTESGMFRKDNAVPVGDLTVENWRDFLIPPEHVLDLPRATFTDISAKRLADGLTQSFAGADGRYSLYLNGSFYGIAECAQGKIKAKTKLC